MNASPPQADIDALNALFERGRIGELLDRGKVLLARFPSSFILCEMLGTASGMLGRDASAVDYLSRAVRIQPDFAIGYLNLGIAFGRLGRREEAAAAFASAAALQPTWAEAHNLHATALFMLGHYAESIAACDKVLALEPDHGEARAHRLIQQAHLCDWDAMAADAHLIPTIGITGHAVMPGGMLALDDSPERHMIRAERFAAAHFPQCAPPLPASPADPSGRLRIGYFSADFRDHAVMQCMAPIFELHDRGRFSIQLFSYGGNVRDDMRRRLEQAADGFHEVGRLADEEIAALARRERIDIAVDLMGYTQGNRLGIFACRAAPIQIGYLGYPGTLGTAFIDYLLADRVVIPPEALRHYAEKVIFLPHSYLPNDSSRPISDRPMTRAEMGLPDQGFIFCCFNNAYKISAREFDVWMRLLDQVENSVLWLSGANSHAKDNLRHQARIRGISPDRLIFSKRLPLADHLARHRLADLFLDCFNYNAHATAADALWAGLPVVTKAGQGFAGRVGASLLTAVGLTELITESEEEYESLALGLARDPAGLSALRARLEANRTTAPLFDSALSTRGIEAAFEQIHGASSQEGSHV